MIEEFLVELEKSQIIVRQDIGQHRKAVIIASFEQPFVQPINNQTSAVCTTDKQPFEQPINTDRVRVLEKEIEKEVAPAHKCGIGSQDHRALQVNGQPLHARRNL